MALGLLPSCGAKRLTDEEINDIVDRRLSALGVTPSAAAIDAGSDVAASKHDPKTRRALVAASTDFLVKLDELMKGYRPELPVVQDQSNMLRCVTADAVTNNPDLAKLKVSIRGKADRALEERRRRERDFFRDQYPLAFHVDHDWKTRKGKPVLAQYGCFAPQSGRWIDTATDASDCVSIGRGTLGETAFQWKVQTPARAALYVYSNSETPPTQPPELMTRVFAADVTLPARFSCRVADVIPAGASRSVLCGEGDVAPQIRLSGKGLAPNIGDVVSVPLADVKRDPDGVLFKQFDGKAGRWIVDADGAALTIDTAASCPTIDEIISPSLAGLGSAATPPSEASAAPGTSKGGEYSKVVRVMCPEGADAVPARLWCGCHANDGSTLLQMKPPKGLECKENPGRDGAACVFKCR